MLGLVLVILLGIIGLAIFLSIKLYHRQKLENAKKEGLLWLTEGKRPYSSTHYVKIRNILSKVKDDEQAAEIVNKLSQLKAAGSEQ